METPKINNTDAAFIFTLGQVVGANPDKIYTMPNEFGCAYVHYVDGGGLCDGCLIGTVLVKLGVPREWFIEVGANTGKGAGLVLEQFGFSREIGIAADRAQNVQDGGEPWWRAGEAFLYTYAQIKA